LSGFLILHFIIFSRSPHSETPPAVEGLSLLSAANIPSHLWKSLTSNSTPRSLPIQSRSIYQATTILPQLQTTTSHHIQHGSSIFRTKCLQVLRLHTQSHRCPSSGSIPPRHPCSCPYQYGTLDRPSFPHPLANEQSVRETQSEEGSEEIDG
jgi:hypothetical protein